MKNKLSLKKKSKISKRSKRYNTRSKTRRRILKRTRKYKSKKRNSRRKKRFSLKRYMGGMEAARMRVSPAVDSNPVDDKPKLLSIIKNLPYFLKFVCEGIERAMNDNILKVAVLDNVESIVGTRITLSEMQRIAKNSRKLMTFYSPLITKNFHLLSESSVSKVDIENLLDSLKSHERSMMPSDSQKQSPPATPDSDPREHLRKKYKRKLKGGMEGGGGVAAGHGRAQDESQYSDVCPICLEGNERGPMLCAHMEREEIMTTDDEGNTTTETLKLDNTYAQHAMHEECIERYLKMSYHNKLNGESSVDPRKVKAPGCVICGGKCLPQFYPNAVREWITDDEGSLEVVEISDKITPSPPFLVTKLHPPLDIEREEADPDLMELTRIAHKYLSPDQVWRLWGYPTSWNIINPRAWWRCADQPESDIYNRLAEAIMTSESTTLAHPPETLFATQLKLKCDIPAIMKEFIGDVTWEDDGRIICYGEQHNSRDLSDWITEHTPDEIKEQEAFYIPPLFDVPEVGNPIIVELPHEEPSEEPSVETTHSYNPLIIKTITLMMQAFWHIYQRIEVMEDEMQTFIAELIFAMYQANMNDR